MAYKILFMGDSITDANRNYNDDNNDGCTALRITVMPQASREEKI